MEQQPIEIHISETQNAWYIVPGRRCPWSWWLTDGSRVVSSGTRKTREAAEHAAQKAALRLK